MGGGVGEGIDELEEFLASEGFFEEGVEAEGEEAGAFVGAGAGGEGGDGGFAQVWDFAEALEDVHAGVIAVEAEVEEDGVVGGGLGGLDGVLECGGEGEVAGFAQEEFNDAADIFAVVDDEEFTRFCGFGF